MRKGIMYRTKKPLLNIEFIAPFRLLLLKIAVKKIIPRISAPKIAFRLVSIFLIMVPALLSFMRYEEARSVPFDNI
jgi:hypothetical protein